MSAVPREAAGGSHWGRSWSMAGDRPSPVVAKSKGTRVDADVSPSLTALGWVASAGDFTPLSLGFLLGGVMGARRSESCDERITSAGMRTVTVLNSESSKRVEGSRGTAPQRHPRPDPWNL